MKPRYMTDWFFDVLPYRRRRSIDWVLPSMVGLGVGVGIGMLLAPQSGAEVRLRLRASADNIKERARDLAERAKRQLATEHRRLDQETGQSRSSEMHEGR